MDYCQVSADERAYLARIDREDAQNDYLERVEIEAAEGEILRIRDEAAEGKPARLAEALWEFGQSGGEEGVGCERIDELLVKLLARYARLEQAGKGHEMPSEVGSIWALVTGYAGDEAGRVARDKAEAEL